VDWTHAGNLPRRGAPTSTQPFRSRITRTFA
jgi:hypothetical protein